MLSILLMAIGGSLVFFGPAVKCQDFGYDGELGPAHWGENYNTCYGKHQSPINIDLLHVERVSLPPLRFVGFDEKPQETSLTNNGHTVMVNMNSERQATIRGGPLNGIYVFSQFHFHWGDNDTFGSEDLIDGKSFPMEIHLVFFKKNYRNARSALNYPDGLTVLAFFYELSPTDNSAYSEFTNLLGSIKNTNDTAEFTNPPTMFQLIGYNQDTYFTYNGSLTTPPCSEVVTWIDFSTPIPLSHNQLEKFRALRDNHGNQLTHNYRPPQPLNDRSVLHNVPDSSVSYTIYDEMPNEGSTDPVNINSTTFTESTTTPLSNRIDDTPSSSTTKTHKKDHHRERGNAAAPKIIQGLPTTLLTFILFCTHQCYYLFQSNLANY